jgi:hypothetical protein
MKRAGSLWLAAIAAVAIAMPAGATDIKMCSAQISALKDNTAAAPFKNAKDESAEIGKLKEADLKLYVAKLADAKQKMLDYQAKLNQVNAAGKLEDPNTWYNLLSNGATAVISCIDQIQ